MSVLDAVYDRWSELIRSYLSEMGNYPVINGKLAFFDGDVYYQYVKAKRSRPSERMLQASMWDISIHEAGDEVIFRINNRKEVEGSKSWNLVNDILSVGTSSYVSKKRMSFFDRYKNRWKFNRQESAGIGTEFVTGFNALLNTAILDSARTVGEEWRSGRL